MSNLLPSLAAETAGEERSSSLTLESFPHVQPRLGSYGSKGFAALPAPHGWSVVFFFDRFGPMTFTSGKPMDVAPHPHIGLQTVSWLMSGEVMHNDSKGGDGAQWLYPWLARHLSEIPLLAIAQTRTSFRWQRHPDGFFVLAQAPLRKNQQKLNPVVDTPLRAVPFGLLLETPQGRAISCSRIRKCTELLNRARAAICSTPNIVA
jgi:hypothetical protein